MSQTAASALRSFIDVSPESHFPIHNLPFGVFVPPDGGSSRVCVAIGEMVLDLSVLEDEGHIGGSPSFVGSRVFGQPSLNAFLALGRPAWSETRAALQQLLSTDSATLRDDPDLQRRALYPLDGIELRLPVTVGDYTDFYSSREHAFNVGTMFRGADNALMPNWLHVPIGYHGRASSVVLSGTDLHRPMGQTKPPDADAPSFGPSRLVDYELEMGFFTGPGNPLGQPIPIEAAHEHIFGLVLVNDWSARDIQAWEYQPLGPFLAKNFGTSIAPWVVTLDALDPFRVASPAQDPVPLPYLVRPNHRAYDIHLETWIDGDDIAQPACITRSNFRHLYWDIAQQLAHHTVTGCNVRPGDLMASGTISGPDKESRGSMLELSWRGQEPLQLPGGATRTFVQDGDRITMTGWCQGDGFRVGFGEVSGRILPARDSTIG